MLDDPLQHFNLPLFIKMFEKNSRLCLDPAISSFFAGILAEHGVDDESACVKDNFEQSWNLRSFDYLAVSLF